MGSVSWRLINECSDLWNGLTTRLCLLQWWVRCGGVSGFHLLYRHLCPDPWDAGPGGQAEDDRHGTPQVRNGRSHWLDRKCIDFFLHGKQFPYLVWTSALYMLSFVRIRITKQLEVEPEEVEAAPVLSESETESQPKTTPRRRSKQNRKDPAAPAAEQVQEKVCDIWSLYTCCQYVTTTTTTHSPSLTSIVHGQNSLIWAVWPWVYFFSKHWFKLWVLFG